ncbi:hypothetical protein D8811_00545 [Streptococcus gordonii]|nr:hypothetical protein D8823_00805 [Streptococcus gordonii]RSJ34658.1 hypothetical protein D8821_03710 [Streptococcus gordonii]RSJ38053.1 hypothetical protein D8822_02915 [Streptococcus gordonii]RSJ43773.1 hypothetical protein D8819_00070 [Streptococcus gordonii]RSJ59085.1 hypothetical protein D8811_00545 [Streptococcus gordonii]
MAVLLAFFYSFVLQKNIIKKQCKRLLFQR